MPTRCRPQVKNNECYNEFCDALDVVVPDAARFPQRTTDIVELYGAAVAAMGPFEEVVEQAAQVKIGKALESCVPEAAVAQIIGAAVALVVLEVAAEAALAMLVLRLEAKE